MERSVGVRVSPSAFYPPTKGASKNYRRLLVQFSLTNDAKASKSNLLNNFFLTKEISVLFR